MTIAALCATLLLLPACGSDPTPRFAPSDPAPTSPGTTLATTPHTTIGPPALPRAARDHTKAGAIAFVKYYWNVVNYAQQSLDVGPLKALADTPCGGCAGAAAFVVNVRTKRGTIEGGINRVSHLSEQPVIAATGATWANVSFALSATRELIDYPGTKSDKVYTGGHNTGLMTLRPVNGGWLVNLLDLKHP